MSDIKKRSPSSPKKNPITRRQFMKLATASVASAGVVSWPNRRLFAAQPVRKRIVIHGERQVTSLGYHNRRETEHVSMVDAGLATQNPVTLERVPVLAVLTDQHGARHPREQLGQCGAAHPARAAPALGDRHRCLP